MWINTLKLLGVALIPIAITTFFIFLRLYGKCFRKLKIRSQLIIISIVFSIVCIGCIELSFATDVGANVSIADSIPVVSGLVFGGPAGIVVGVVGGIYRFFISYAQPTLMVTQQAASLSLIVAGIFTYLIRRFVFNKHHGKWISAFFITFLVEDFHMILAFLTNMQDLKNSFNIVTSSLLPQVFANCFAATLCSVVASLVAREKLIEKSPILKLITKVQMILVASLLMAYGIVSSFAYFSIRDLTRNTNNDSATAVLSDVQKNVNLEINKYLANLSLQIRDEIDADIEVVDLNEMVFDLKLEWLVSEVNIVDKSNIIKHSTEPDYINFDMADPNNKQSREFIFLNEDNPVSEYYVQDIQPPSSGKTMRNKYAAAKIGPNSKNMGFVQIGLYEDAYHALLDEELQDCCNFRHINKEGFLVVTDSSGKIVSVTEDAIVKKGEMINLKEVRPNYYKYQFGKDRGDQFFTIDVDTEGYHVIAFSKVDEVNLAARIGFFGITLAEIFVFMALYCVLFIVIKRTVTNRIENISKGLNKIANGDLNVTIEEHNSLEMDSLSNDINRTVNTLKENARKEAQKNAQELEFAKTIQHSVLPQVFPLHEKFEIFASMDTAKEVGGDFYDFFLLDHHRVVIEVADVSGKGVPAALFMMQSKTIIKNLVETGMPINEAYTEANRRLCETNDAQMFVTAWLGVIDLETGHVDFVNAGHNPPIVCGEDGTYHYLKSKCGFVLGGFEGFKYQLQSFQMKPGDRLFLYTDGVTEAMNKDHQQFGEKQLLDIVEENKNRGPNTICTKVRERVVEFADGAEQSDDITMICIALQDDKTSDTMVVDAKINNVGMVTKFVNDLLDKHGATPKAKSSLDVAIDEIFSNICYYAYKPDQSGKVKVATVFEDNKVHLVFEDCGVPYNPLEKPDPDATASLEDREIGGLGIFIVKKTMDNMEYRLVNRHNILKLTKTIK